MTRKTEAGSSRRDFLKLAATGAPAVARPKPQSQT